MKNTVLITGATGGLGQAFADIFARNNYDLVLTGRKGNVLEALKIKLENKYKVKVWIMVQDLSEDKAVNNIYSFTTSNKIHIDVLINNAGFGDYGYFWKQDISKQDDLLNVNIIRVVELTRLYLPSMIDKGHGKILNVASAASLIAGPKMSLYYASKAFVKSFSEALAFELKETNIKVTALCLGPTKTGFEKHANLKQSNMFNLPIKPSNPYAVANAGYKSLMKGKVIRYYGIITNLTLIGSKLLPSSITTKIANYVNSSK